MTDADKVLNWVGEKHCERRGMEHKKTVAHVLHVSDLYGSWSRTEDAISLLSRAMDKYDKTIRLENANEDSDSTAAVDRSSQFRSRRSLNGHRQSAATVIDLTGDDTLDPGHPSYVQYQLGLAKAQVEAHNGSAHILLTSLIESCEEHPKELGEQILEARTALVEHYQKYGENAKMEEALDQTVKSVWKVLKSDVKKTPSFLEAAMDVAENTSKPVVLTPRI
jgi:hypothetical protein